VELVVNNGMQLWRLIMQIQMQGTSTCTAADIQKQSDKAARGTQVQGMLYESDQTKVAVQKTKCLPMQFVLLQQQTRLSKTNMTSG